MNRDLNIEEKVVILEETIVCTCMDNSNGVYTNGHKEPFIQD